ncbi:DUF3012 domain-containing protein [Spongiibacter sp. KMU-166]|uniref:DUF3012 domain-containing protein n=2 Tax=Spongiibacter thalassae TaxID=2721624 RepID=A0ABX1GCH9_9GAMM|nr:DUF3012 domain-containing protein [Spongiibacter thalassae]
MGIAEDLMNKIKGLLLLTAILVTAACAPEVGSEAWCKAMSEKPKGDWTANELSDYTKSCVFK